MHFITKAEIQLFKYEQKIITSLNPAKLSGELVYKMHINKNKRKVPFIKI